MRFTSRFPITRLCGIAGVFARALLVPGGCWLGDWVVSDGLQKR